MAKATPDSLRGKRLAAYIRLSSDKQDAERQRMAIREWATRHGLEIEHWLEDTKGRNPRDQSDKRLDFQKALKLAEAGLVEAIVVDAQDRFGVKNSHEWGKYMWQLRKAGAQLWSVQEGLLSSDDDATILTTTLGTITSRREQKEKSWRILEGRKKNSERGNWPGGRPPYGMDVVCYDDAGREKYRVVWEGHQKRVKITGKTRERFDGKDNVPAKNQRDVLKCRPSVVKERLKWVRQMFSWVDEEGLSPKAVADRLNELGVGPIFGRMWYKQIVKPLLMNPIYIGFPTDNKRGGGRFYEFVGGQVREVDSPNGGRRREESDWWRAPEQQFDPIIDPDQFNRVQKRLRDSAEEHKNPSRRPPRTAGMWLKGLLICGRCGLPMHANASEKGRNVPSYFCSMYNRYGNTNPTGCRCHRVRAEVVEEVVQRYITESHERIDALMQAASKGDDSLLTPIVGELDDTRREILGVFCAMAMQIEKSGGKSKKPTLSMPAADLARVAAGQKADTSKWTLSLPSLDVYEAFFKRAKPRLEKKLVELNEEHDLLIERLVQLPKGSLAVDKLTQRIAELEAEMQAVKADSENLIDKLEALVAAFQQRRKIVAELREKFSQESAYIRKRELLQQVVAKIVLHFEYHAVKAANRPKSVLNRVEIYPASGGEPTCFSSVSTLVPG